jgi:4-hydroxymandelate oxidase
VNAPRQDTLPAGVATAADYAAHAQARLDPVAWRYLQDASGDSLTDTANRHAFHRTALMPRMLADVRGGHTRLSLFGQTLDHPIQLAPVAYQRLFHEGGECASAMAAAAQGGAIWISSLASQPIESIMAASRATGGPVPGFQLYWQGERDRTLRLLRRAEAAGCAALMFTVDAPVKLATLDLPRGIAAVNLEQPLSLPTLPAGHSPVFDGWMAQAPTWDDLAWLRDATRLPLLVKGVLHADDAARAVALGCDGLVVSNHGGRVLDGAPASLDALPAVLEQVNGRVPVIVDSGVRTGRDAFRARALGASAVLVGRPPIWGLASAGALGVAHVIRLLRDELEATMALCGCRTLDDITPACLAPPRRHD